MVTLPKMVGRTNQPSVSSCVPPAMVVVISMPFVFAFGSHVLFFFSEYFCFKFS